MTSAPHATSSNELSHLGFAQQFTTVKGLKLCSYSNINAEHGLDAFSKKAILILLHGYPQSPYLWRHIAPQLASAGYPLFIPDLPGYANSPDRAQSLPQDKLTIGTTLLESLQQHLSALPNSPTSSPQDIILITHDRGARVGHRLAVSQPLSEKFRLKAVCLMDIVPTSEQFAGLGRIPVALGYFHWPMLANVDIATRMIASMGGAKWVEEAIGRMRASQDAKDATAVYATQFDDEDIIRATCRDYEAAAKVDVAVQVEDQKEGRKVDVPILVLWSAAGLGNWFDVEGVWRQWIKDGTDTEFHAIEDEASHYLAEDAPEIVGKRLLDWLQRVDK